MATVIDVQHLVKEYPGVRAVDGLSFHVERGEIFGLLGPNGAGKTTTLSIIEGLLPPDAGTVLVFGMDVRSQAFAIKQRIGVQLQSTSLIPDLTAVEQVLLFSALYGHRRSRTEALALLERVELGALAHRLPEHLSGGQKQRLALALALVNDPDIVFLDEPTAGLDPQSRHALWEIIRQLQTAGCTVVLTTHYMEEAESLCHRVGIVDHGRLLALDTPAALVSTFGGTSTITCPAAKADPSIHHMPGVVSVREEGAFLRIQTNDHNATITALLQHGYDINDLHVKHPSLEDVFLHLTGKEIRA
nr:ABC transporter ATP-binding protein [Ardenticatena sp.]